MHIKCCQRRTQGGVLLAAIAVGVLLVLGGCAGKKIFDKLKKVQDKIGQKQTNDMPEIVFTHLTPITRISHFGPLRYHAPDAVASPRLLLWSTNLIDWLPSDDPREPWDIVREEGPVSVELMKFYVRP